MHIDVEVTLWDLIKYLGNLEYLIKTLGYLIYGTLDIYPGHIRYLPSVHKYLPRVSTVLNYGS